ncbi:MAG: PspC domain-containing protein [Propionibacteriales bacterium]|nr:PspC domain-containing protein [Propionibacteriales bacterium]
MTQQPNTVPDTGPRVTRGQMRDLTRVRRAADDHLVAGVCEGLSRHFDIDPIVIRVIFGALTVFGGAGVVLYVLAWITIPRDGSYDSPASGWLHRDPERILVAGLSIAAVAAVATMIGTIGVSAPNPFPAVVIGCLALILFALLTRRSQDRHAPGDATTNSETNATSTATTQTPTQSPIQSPIDAGDRDRPWWRRPATTRNAQPSDGDGPTGPSGPPIPPAPPTVPSSRSTSRRARAQRSRLLSTTLAVIAIALGTVWMLAETVFADIEPSVYPGTVLGIVAIALLIGAWYGRSRTLIAVGLFASMVTVVTTVVGPGPYGEQTHRPQTAAAVESTYQHGAGQFNLDLTDVADVDALDGRTTNLDVSVGAVDVVVPTSIDATIRAHVRGGEITGSRQVVDLGQGSQDLILVPEQTSAPDVTIEIDLEFGQINLMRVDCPGDSGASARTGLTANVSPTPLTTTGGTRVPTACN